MEQSAKEAQACIRPLALTCTSVAPYARRRQLFSTSASIAPQFCCHSLAVCWASGNWKVGLIQIATRRREALGGGGGIDMSWDLDLRIVKY